MTDEVDVLFSTDPEGVVAARFVGFDCSDGDGLELAGPFLSLPFGSDAVSGSSLVALVGEPVCVAITGASLGASESSGASSASVAIAAIEEAAEIELAESVELVGLVRAPFAVGTEESVACAEAAEAVAACWLALGVAAAPTVASALVESDAVGPGPSLEVAEPEPLVELPGGDDDFEAVVCGVPRFDAARTCTSPLGGTTAWFGSAGEPEPFDFEV